MFLKLIKFVEEFNVVVFMINYGMLFNYFNLLFKSCSDVFEKILDEFFCYWINCWILNGYKIVCGCVDFFN